MKIITKKPLVLAMGFAMTIALPFFVSADGTPSYVTTESSNSANAVFSIDQNGAGLEVMAEFGYFRSTTQGSIGDLPIPVDAGGGIINEPGVDSPLVPGNSEHAYLILNVMPLMLFPNPEPIPEPSPDPIIVDPIPDPNIPVFDTTNPVTDPVLPEEPPFTDPGPGGDILPPDFPPTEPLPFPNEPAYEVLYFELTPAQINITNTSTSIEVDTCLQPQASLYFEQCGVISINWMNTSYESMKTNTNSLTKTSNGIFGQPMTIKGTSALFYSSASATMDAMGQTLVNDFGGRSASKSEQQFHMDNEFVIVE